VLKFDLYCSLKKELDDSKKKDVSTNGNDSENTGTPELLDVSPIKRKMVQHNGKENGSALKEPPCKKTLNMNSPLSPHKANNSCL